MLFLSIVIPTFNAGSHLEGALKSLARQTFRDFEVIVIDGLSKDNTKEIFSRLSGSLPGATWVSEKDEGIYDAMNKGIKKAQGEWIYFLGNDDRLHDETVLEKVHRFVSTTPANVIYGNILSKAFKQPYDGVFSAKKIYHQNISHQAIFVKRQVFDIVGVFSLKYRILSDWEHNLRWFFSDRVIHAHFDFIVADYGVEGVSSKSIDSVFFRDRDWRYVVNGRRKLGVGPKLKLVLKEYRACVRERDIARLFKSLASTPAILLGI